MRGFGNKILQCGSFLSMRAPYANQIINFVWPKSYTMVGENFEINSVQMAKIAAKSSIMVVENFEINSTQFVKIASKHGWRKFDN